jgi:hypothetical protein
MRAFLHWVAVGTAACHNSVGARALVTPTGGPEIVLTSEPGTVRGLEWPARE